MEQDFRVLFHGSNYNVRTQIVEIVNFVAEPICLSCGQTM